MKVEWKETIENGVSLTLTAEDKMNKKKIDVRINLRMN